MDIKFTKITENAKTPTRGSEFSAGFDLFAPQESIIEGNSRKVILTDISIEIPHNHFGLIATRSSMAINYIDVVGGIIDSDFRGNIGVILSNKNNSSFTITKGQKIAQILLIPIIAGSMREVDALTTTTRDRSGWGSTGK